jgi:hypothetical protein
MPSRNSTATTDRRAEQAAPINKPIDLAEAHRSAPCSAHAKGGGR